MRIYLCLCCGEKDSENLFGEKREMCCVGKVITESEKTGKIEQYEFSCENMVEVTRIMLTFKPKRNHRLCQVQVLQWI